MKLVHRANACFSIFLQGKHILCDPWLNGPAVAQGWTPFPPSTKRIEDLPKPDLVYISHIHSDHCEETTLDGINKQTPVVIMDLPPNFLKKRLIGLGFTNVTLMREKYSDTLESVFEEVLGELKQDLRDEAVKVLEMGDL